MSTTASISREKELSAKKQASPTASTGSRIGRSLQNAAEKSAEQTTVIHKSSSGADLSRSLKLAHPSHTYASAATNSAATAAVAEKHVLCESEAEEERVQESAMHITNCIASQVDPLTLSSSRAEKETTASAKKTDLSISQQRAMKNLQRLYESSAGGARKAPSIAQSLAKSTILGSNALEKSTTKAQVEKVQEEPTPVQDESTPVQEEQAPVQEEQAPVQDKPTPVQKEPTPVQEEPTPVQKETVAEKQETSHIFDQEQSHVVSQTETINQPENVEQKEAQNALDTNAGAIVAETVAQEKDEKIEPTVPVDISAEEKVAITQEIETESIAAVFEAPRSVDEPLAIEETKTIVVSEKATSTAVKSDRSEAQNDVSQSFSESSTAFPTAPALPPLRVFSKARFAAIDQIQGAMTRPLIYRVEPLSEDSAVFEPIKIVSFRKEQLTYDNKSTANGSSSMPRVIERRIIAPVVESAPDAATLEAHFDLSTNAVVLHEHKVADAPILPGAVLLFSSLEALARALTYRLNTETGTWVPCWSQK